MLTVDPLRLAKRQLEIDGARTKHFPHLLAHKADRMRVSPLAFLRGSAPLFYEILEAHPSLREGPSGKGWLVGDAHVENFGAYRAGLLRVDETKASHAKDAVVFDLNDFDDAVVGPWRFDVLRLVTSLILGGRESGTDGVRTIQLSDALVGSYAASVFGHRHAPTLPRVVTDLVDKVQKRTRKELLDARTEIVRGRRRFVRGPHFEELTPKLRAKAERALAKYAKRLPDAERVPDEALEVADAAFRVAGTGSLGCLRVALLVTGKGGVDGNWVFDMKAQGAASARTVVAISKAPPAERVCTAVRACLARPPRMIGTTMVRGESMFVRRLAPQDDKLDLTHIGSDGLEPLARHLGWLLGQAHRRGAVRMPKNEWKREDRDRLLDRAIALAGMHEAMYLAYCDLVR